VAQSSDAQRFFAEGRAAFERQDYANALASFEAAAAARLDGPAIHFNIGVAAYRLGHYDKARAAFERVALTPAMSGLAHYNLGLVALAQGEQSQAIDAFTRAYAESEDERIRGLARSQLEAIGTEAAPRGITWAAYGSTGVGYDDNVTLTSGGQALGITREKDAYGDTLIAASAQLTDSLRLDADASWLNYASLDEFDQWTLGLGARYRIATDPWTLDTGAQLGTTWVGGERFDMRESVYVQATGQLATRLSLRARYRLSNVDGSSDYPGLAGLRHEVSARVTHRGAAWTTSFAYGFEITDYHSAALSAMRHLISADVRAPLSQAWAARASLAYRYSEYDDKTIGAEQRTEFGTGLEYAVNGRWTVALQYLFTDNESDTPEFTYRRNRVFAGVEATF
jgi:tetratricopeptide (TPR) repeat protein